MVKEGVLPWSYTDRKRSFFNDAKAIIAAIHDLKSVRIRLTVTLSTVLFFVHACTHPFSWQGTEMLSGIEKQPVIIKQGKAAMDQFAKWIR